MRLMPILFTLMCVLIFSCGKGRTEANDAELAEAAEAGQHMALQALIYPKGSMKRENAILAVRARETRLRLAGFNICADTFAASAEKIFMDSIK